MKQVILTRGLPASGKSTWAVEQLALHPGMYKRITKDLLRDMLDGKKWTPKNEKLVLKVRDNLILLFLGEGYHVIVDDTNLHPKHEQHVRELVKGQATVGLQDFTHVPLDVCIERDRIRPNSVGEKEIRRMYREFLQPKVEPPVYDPTLPDAVICDLDGTLALLVDRSPYDASTCASDMVNEAVADILRRYHRDGHTTLLVSGRQEKDRLPTELWLEKNAIPRSDLLMRPTGDQRKDSVVKQEIYERDIRGKYNVRFILDDRQQVVDMWRSLGLTCLQVADGPD